MSSLQDNLEMAKLFLAYTGKEFLRLKDLKAIDPGDTWPDDFEGDKIYLEGQIESLKKESKLVQETVSDHRRFPRRTNCKADDRY